MAGECHPVGGEENSRIRNKNDDAGENDPFMLPAVGGPANPVAWSCPLLSLNIRTNA
jgi:hypothetical protein